MTYDLTKSGLLPEQDILYCFWTGTTPVSKNRVRCIRNLKTVPECKVIPIHPGNLSEYILDEHPLHEAYQYLSETHKADYLRTYFMHFYGGGYSDIKCASGTWAYAYRDIRNYPDCWINGAHELSSADIACEDVKEHWKQLLSNGAYIVRSNTEFTREWYHSMMSVMDEKTEQLCKYPARYAQESSENSKEYLYPLEWNELLGRIFHRVLVKYLPHVMYTIPRPIMINYR
jgi:hypothetical protein